MQVIFTGIMNIIKILKIFCFLNFYINVLEFIFNNNFSSFKNALINY